MSETMAKMGSGMPTTAHGLSSQEPTLKIPLPQHEATNSLALGSGWR